MRIAENNLLLITLTDWKSAGLTEMMYKNARRRNQINATRACKGRPTEIVFDSIPASYKDVIVNKLGDPRTNAIHQSFREIVEADHKSVEYYTNYKLADGRSLSSNHIKEYCINANVLNALRNEFTSQSTARKALGGSMKGFWTRALNAIETVRGEMKHTLPGNEAALKRKYQRYVSMGYEGLISGKFCNDNSRKVTDCIERLIMSLYIMPNKPFAADVHSLYMQFLAGTIQVPDTKTGELFLPEDFMKDDKPVEISENTVWNYLNQPQNRFIVDKARSGQFQFNNLHRPHHHRNAPNFAFSKITMDDRDLPRKMSDGKRVKAYYAYDVASGCVVGAAYSRTKDEELFIDCMQNMFRLIDQQGFGMPLEVEVENHLVNKFFDQLALMFPFVRICNPGNSQEKHAEHLNRAKKYGIEKQMGHTNGRWWSKHEAYREDAPKSNDEYKFKVFTYEQLVADDKAACIAFNNMLHPKQKKYPGKTRWQVLVENINPSAPQVFKPVAYKAFGDRTKTSIHRNQYCTVQHSKFQLSSPTILKRLQPGNYEVEAFYLPDADGIIREVFLYQNNEYVGMCEPIETYNTAKAEWTELDSAAYTNQAKYVSEFDKIARDGKDNLASLTIIDTKSLDKAVAAPATILEKQVLPSDDIEDLLKNYDPEEYKKRSNENI
jgi:hypothetical protein